jgi:hypothetical protein
MRQALHIFQKDARYLRNELCLLVGLAIVFAWAATHSANPVWAELLLGAAAVWLIARLVHAEAIPGDRQFWITRPYRWEALLAAKLLALVVFVNLPVFAARAYVLVATGFPFRTTLAPLVWSQFVMFLGASIPIAALAAVTPGIVPFTFTGLILLAMGLGIDTRIAPPSTPAVRLALSSSQWVWNSIAVLTLVAFAAPVLYLQYRKRWTFLSRCVVLCAGAAGALAYLYVPWPAAAAIQNSISPRRFDGRAVRVRLEPGARRFFPMGMMWRRGVQVDLPIAVEGIPADAEFLPSAVALTFQAADGSAWSTGPYLYPALAKQVSGPGRGILNANVDVPQAFFDKAKPQRVTVKGSLYLTVFGNPQALTIPLQATPVNVPGGLQCSLGPFRQLGCRSAFRWPNRLVYAKFEDNHLRAFTRMVSYSPFPAGLDFLTVEARQVSAPQGEHQVTIVVKELLASLRHDFEIEDFGLPAYATPR